MTRARNFILCITVSGSENPHKYKLIANIYHYISRNIILWIVQACGYRWNSFKANLWNIHWEYNGSLTIYYTCFRTISVPYFLPFESYRPLNDASRPAFNAISHEWHVQIYNRKTSLLYSIPYFTYPHWNIINTHRIVTITETKDWPLVRDLLRNLCFSNTLTFEKSLLW
jgi:hypothetical protein